MSFKESVLEIKKDIYTLKSREDTFKSLIKNVLNNNFERYAEFLKINENYLLSRSNIKVLKTIMRELKKERRNEL